MMIARVTLALLIFAAMIAIFILGFMHPEIVLVLGIIAVIIWLTDTAWDFAGELLRKRS